MTTKSRSTGFGLEKPDDWCDGAHEPAVGEHWASPQTTGTCPECGQGVYVTKRGVFAVHRLTTFAGRRFGMTGRMGRP